MKRTLWSILPALALLTACAQEAADREPASAEEAVPGNEFGFKQELSPTFADPDDKAQANAEAAAAQAAAGAGKAADKAAGVQAADTAATAPRIAYAYSFGFRVSGEDMPGLQRRHVALCEKLGVQTCRVLEMSQSAGDEQYAHGKLVMEVAAPTARTFGDQLSKAAEGTGGSLISSAVSGEDLSKQIIDTEARLRARILLRDRLMELLATRKGTVAELIEAERGVAAVNQEIDEAQSWLKEMKGRVDFSRVEITYESSSRAGLGFLSPIVSVLENLGTILGVIVAGLIVITVALVPIGLFAWALIWLRRRIKAWRMSGTAKDPSEAEG